MQTVVKTGKINKHSSSLIEVFIYPGSRDPGVERHGGETNIPYEIQHHPTYLIRCSAGEPVHPRPMQLQ